MYPITIRFENYLFECCQFPNSRGLQFDVYRTSDFDLPVSIYHNVVEISTVIALSSPIIIAEAIRNSIQQFFTDNGYRLR